jgi:hypothetical protein
MTYIWQVFFLLGTPLILSILAGSWLEKDRFEPWGIIGGLAIGLFIGSILIYKQIKNIQKKLS